jgi:Calcineurin-like phosphoesterase
MKKVNRGALAFVTCALAFASGCGKNQVDRAAAKPTRATAEAASPKLAPAPAPAAAEDTSYRYPTAERIVAVGDLHGDLQATRAALRLASVLSADDHWAGGKTVVVQTGDQLDRGDDEPEILDLLERLAKQASAAGGAFHVLNGNHEVMNVQGDFRYVTPGGFQDFEHTPPNELHAGEIHGLPAAAQGRGYAFLSGESAAKRLAARPIVIQVGDNVFVHGGLLVSHVRQGLGKINRQVQEWMRSPASKPAPAIAMSEQSPLWLRIYSDGTPQPSACQELASVLQLLGAKRLVVGHTVQKQGVNSACDGKVWRIDVGLSRSYGNPPGALEIKGDATRVLSLEQPATAASVVRQ